MMRPRRMRWAENIDRVGDMRYAYFEGIDEAVMF
jgi:hypothetical protein